MLSTKLKDSAVYAALGLIILLAIDILLNLHTYLEHAVTTRICELQAETYEVCQTDCKLCYGCHFWS